MDGAIADFNRAIELDPKDDAPYYNRAQAKRLKKDTAGAIADYTRAIELGSTNPAAYNNRGNARAENNDRDGAIADYTRAIEHKSDYARAYYLDASEVNSGPQHRGNTIFAVNERLRLSDTPKGRHLEILKMRRLPTD